MEQSLSLDLETRSKVDIKLGAWRYAEDPSTSLLCMAYQFPGEDPELWWPHQKFPKRIAKWIKAGGLVRAFNVEFELAIWTRVIRRTIPGLPKLKARQLRCTQAEACAMALPQDLAGCAKAVKVPQDKEKGAEGKKLIQYLCRPWKGAFREDPERLAALGAYCLQDVVAETAVARKVRRLDKQELRLFHRNLVMNAKGLQVDLYLVGQMQRRYHELKQMAIENCQVITGGISPMQTAKFTEWAGLPNMQKKTVERAIAADHPHKHALGFRQTASSTSLAKLDKLPLAVCQDGTMKGLFKFHGASTGRWVSQGGFNAQNLPRGSLSPEQIQNALQQVNGLNTAELVSLLRAVFCGQMSVVDYSQIETRVLLWLAGDRLALDDFRLGRDPYMTMAAQIFHRPYDAVTKNMRQIGKTVVLACGFGQGWRGFINYADGQDLTITEEESQRYVGAYRKKHDLVVDAWANMQAAAVTAIENKGKVYFACRCRFVVKNDYLWMILPSGRRIAYKSPWLVQATGEDAWKGKQINYWGRDRYTRQWSEQETYGGSLFQSATQGTARDIMADAMLRMGDQGLDVRGTVHDEVICYGDVQDQMEEIMSQLPSWAAGIPIAAEGWTGGYYRK